ncbi:PrsW family intramembrane metalloprotease, partial [bacterium]|nr:PrsW family intramembrane metalloprotease [bacterium]
VIIVFFAGAIIVIPTAYLERTLSLVMGVQSPGNAADAAKVSWIIAGLIEEGAKLAVVMLIIWKRTGFNEPMDGLVYAAAASLGFASAENIIYIKEFGATVILIRGPMSVLGHMLFSSIWGYTLGRAKFERSKRFSLLVRGFVLSAFFHGLYDFLIFTKIIASIALYILMGLLWNILLRMFADAESRSPFTLEKNRD